MYQTTSSFIELTSVDYNFTNNNISNDSSSTDTTLSGNNPESNSFGKDEKSQVYEFFLVFILLTTISCIVYIVYSKYSKISKKNYCLENDRLHAHPFEEILLGPNELGSDESNGDGPKKVTS